ncbi:MAG: hypothetical protein ACT4TC_10375 [Myxococcaceae bacterium]
MSGTGTDGKGISLYLGMSAGVGSVALVLAYLVPSGNAGKLAALIGVGASAVSGAVSLLLKYRAVRVSVNAALKVMGVVFAIRLALVGAGLMVVLRSGFPPMPFVVGFFSVYFVQQWIEISYVLAEQQKGKGPT